MVTGALAGPAPQDELARDCAAFGLTPPSAPAATAPALWACHLPAVAAFAASATQWRIAPVGHGFRFVGLDYAAVRAGLDLAQIDLTPGEWADFRVVEEAAKAALNEG